MPALAQWPLDIVASCGGAFRQHSQLMQGYERGGWGRLWVEWEVAVERLAAFLWCLGEEVEAGAQGAARGSSQYGGEAGLATGAPAAVAAARRAGAWPPKDPAMLAGAAAAALLLLSRWQSMRAALVPSEAAVGRRSGTVSLRLQRRLPEACRQLVAAACAALGASKSSRVMRSALPPALDAASTACKLVRLACTDVDHWVLLGAASAHASGPEVLAAAAARSSTRGSPAEVKPYRPVTLTLAAAAAVERGVRRLLLAPGVLQDPEAAYLRR